MGVGSNEGNRFNILALLPQLNIQFIQLNSHSARWPSLHAGLPTLSALRRRIHQYMSLRSREKWEAPHVASASERNGMWG